MTVNKTIAVVWAVYAVLISGLLFAEIHILKQPAPRSLATLPKSVYFDDSPFQRASTLLYAKNNLVAGSYAQTQPVAKKDIKSSPVKKGKIKKKRLRVKKGAISTAQPKRIKHKKVSTPQAVRRSVKRVKKTAKRVQRRTTIKPAHIKAGAVIKPTTAYTAWRTLQREPLFCWPVEPSAFWVSSLFGPRKLGGRRGFHAGVDLAAPRGTPVYAAASGIVTEAAYSGGYGNYIMVAHNRKYKTRYAHLDKIHVYVGDTVSTGDCIGCVGATGYVRKSRRGGSAAHLHFEVYMKGKPVNPFYFLA